MTNEEQNQSSESALESAIESASEKLAQLEAERQDVDNEIETLEREIAGLKQAIRSFEQLDADLSDDA